MAVGSGIELGTGWVTILPSAKGFQAAMDRELSGVGDKAGKNLSGQMAGAVEKDTSKSGRLGKAFGGIGGIIAGGFAGGAAIKAVTDVVGGFVSAAQESQVVGKQTAEVLKSTGGAAGVSAQQISDLATSLSLKSGVDDEVVQSGENVLLTFTKVANQAGKGNDIFNQGTSIALDMSTALGTDLQGSVIQVGKALNDPIKGITALQRVGVTFTDQQKEQIKTLVESGDTLGAQKIILGELNTEFGGMAAASATSGDKLKVAWGNVQEQLGNVLLPIFEKVATWLSDELPGAVAWAQDAIGTVQAFFEEHRKQFEAVGTVLRLLFDYLKIQVKIFVEAVKIEFAVIRDIVVFFNDWVYQPLKTAFVALFDFLSPFVQGAVSGIITTWHVMQDVYTFFRDNVYTPVKNTVLALIGDVSGAFGQAVSGAKTAWNVIQDVFTFFRDNVYNPVKTAVQDLSSFVAVTFATAVAGVRIAWGGISAVFTFFRDNVYNPISTAVTDLMNGVVRAFQLGVAVVGVVWDGLKRIIGAPINVVIDFYNRGIAGLWNFVANRVAPDLALPTIKPLQFATGGRVPGTGNRDTVRIMATPGEFIINKKAAQQIGTKTLEALNSGGTLDPGILGYAAGGVVKSVAETQDWMRQQVGKPYVFPLSGPTAYDCSGLISALINFVLGLNPYSRRHSSGTVGQDKALQAGDGDPARGLLVGARPPYTQNRQGQLVGHETSTVAGVAFEATPPAVRMGGAARGAFALPQHYFMPGFGGPNDDEQGVIASLKALLSLKLPGLGGGGLGDLLTKLFVQVPKMAFDFLVTKVPQIIKDALVEGGVASGGSANPLGTAIGLIHSLPFLGNGGRIGRDGPFVAGDGGRPEIVWGSRGEYVQANAEGRAAASRPIEAHFHYETRIPTATEIAGALQMARLAS